jgi:hypothetical protein
VRVARGGEDSKFTMEGERGRDSFLGWPRGRICAASRFSTSARRGRAASSAARGVSGLFAFHVPNGGWRTRTEGAILKGAGVVAGVPDIILINAGRTYALELKADGGSYPQRSRRRWRPWSGQVRPSLMRWGSTRRWRSWRAGACCGERST